MDDDLPPNDYYEYYAPLYKLHIEVLHFTKIKYELA